MSTVYLLHFDQAYKHAKHYLGVAEDLNARLEQHRAGSGARLLAVLKGAGIGWSLARTWQGDRKLERRLKRRKDARRICPACSGDQAKRRAKFCD